MFKNHHKTEVFFRNRFRKRFKSPETFPKKFRILYLCFLFNVKLNTEKDETYYY